MRRWSTKTIARVAAALMAASGALGILGPSLLEGGPSAGAVPAEAVAVTAPARPAPPELEALLRVADHVSEDGSYVVVGDVGMSAATVSRAAGGR